jgi:hypothetical protein
MRRPLAAIAFLLITLALGATSVSTGVCVPRWHIVRIDSSKTFTAIEASSPSDVWAVGVARMLPLVEHWDGERWRVLPAPRIAANSTGELDDIAPVAPDDVWTGGSVYNHGRTRALLAHWDGSSWTAARLAAFSPLPVSRLDIEVQSLLAISTDDVWAIVVAWDPADEAPPEQLYAEHWDGSAWTAVKFPFGADTSFTVTEMSALASSDVWAAGAGNCGPGGCGYEISAHWNGRRWRSVPTGPTAAGYGGYPDGCTKPGFTGVAAITPTKAWAVGWGEAPINDPDNAPSSSCPFIKRWNGRSWQLAKPLGLPIRWALNDIEGGSSNVWAFGEQDKSVIRPLVARWDGTRWESVAEPPLQGKSRALDDGEVLAPDDLWAVGHGTVAHYVCA